MTKEQIEQKAKELVNEIDYSGITNPKSYTAIMMAEEGGEKEMNQPRLF